MMDVYSVALETIYALRKGDKPGHEFRGNQWTAGKNTVIDIDGKDVLAPDPKVMGGWKAIKASEKYMIGRMGVKSAALYGKIMNEWTEESDKGYGMLLEAATASLFGSSDPEELMMDAETVIMEETDNDDYDVEEEFTYAKRAVKEMYKSTQETLREMFPDGYVTLFRGFDGSRHVDEMKDGVVVLDALSSFTSEEGIARLFADNYSRGSVMKINVPIDRILTCALTSSDLEDRGEGEFLVIGSDNTFKAQFSEAGDAED